MQPFIIKLVVCGFFLASSCSLLQGAQGEFALPRPPQPRITIHGRKGNGRAAYWIIARNKKGRLTMPSEPLVVDDLPDILNNDNYIEITPVSLSGAAEYLVLKTMPMTQKIKATIKSGKSGIKKYYYWVQWCNNWRESSLSGPFVVNCNQARGNVISWEPIKYASWYNVFRTDTPEPPIGRGFFAVGLQVAAVKSMGYNGAVRGPTTITDKGRLAQAVCGRPATSITEPPMGEGLFLLGKVKGNELITIKDTGQALQRVLVPNVNETQRINITGPSANQGNIAGFLGGQYVLRPENRIKHLRMPSFSAGHLETMVVENRVPAGGHSEYPNPGNGTKGWKSWIAAVSARVISHTASQHGSLTGHLDVYGSGDAIPLCSMVNMYGSNNDPGDEGTYSIRNSVRRRLNAYEAYMAADAMRGSEWLRLNRLSFNAAGTERLVVNKTQTHQQGRISHVDNCDVFGRGTEWKSNMRGWWISFDVDTIKGGSERGASSARDDYRMWYWVTEVVSPTHLRILAKTGWSNSCNLGYSRFIWDPETMKGPRPTATNSGALTRLPDDKKAAAENGGYWLCPGVLLADDWKRGRSLHVEPLQQKWNKGDKIRITAGPQAFVAMGRFMLWGDYLPQDMVGGLDLRNNGNRRTNFPAIQIGTPGKNNFSVGVEVSLPQNGDGDGIVISAATGWDHKGFPDGNGGVRRAAVVVPDNIPAMVGEHNWRYPHIRWEFKQQGKPDSLVIGMKNAPAAARFDRKGNTEIRSLKISEQLKGNFRTRGKAIFRPNGEERCFTIKFKHPCMNEPFVTISTNQFIPSRLAQVSKDGFQVEFQQPPHADKDVIIYWLAQE